MARAFVGLGSNLGDRENVLNRAVEALGALSGTDVVAVSSFRDTEPLGIVDQPRFLNGAAELDEPGLAVPHPRLAERAFVLEPLAELDPALEVPGKGRVEALLAKLHSA